MSVSSNQDVDGLEPEVAQSNVFGNLFSQAFEGPTYVKRFYVALCR